MCVEFILGEIYFFSTQLNIKTVKGPCSRYSPTIWNLGVLFWALCSNGRDTFHRTIFPLPRENDDLVVQAYMWPKLDLSWFCVYTYTHTYMHSTPVFKFPPLGFQQYYIIHAWLIDFHLSCPLLPLPLSFAFFFDTHFRYRNWREQKDKVMHSLPVTRWL